MKRLHLSKWLVVVAVFGIVILPSLSVGATYDLQTDWSNTNNPNGTWAYLQGSNPLPLQNGLLIGAGWVGVPVWAPGNNWLSAGGPGFLPLWYKASDGNVYMHSVDGTNGIPANGPAILAWTAPAAGTISISGSIWYTQLGLGRSQDFLLFLGSAYNNSIGATTTGLYVPGTMTGGALLASGTVNQGNGYDSQSSALAFSTALAPGQTLTGLPVTQGEVLSLVITPSAGSIATMSGVVMTVTESPVPLPAGILLFGPGLVGLAAVRRRLKK